MFRPEKAAVEIRSHPRWLFPFIFLASISVVSYALVHPLLVQKTLDHLPLSATKADKQIVADNLSRELPAKLAFYPIRLFMGWSAFALVLLYVCRSWGTREPVRFRQMFSLEVHSEVTSAIGGVIATISALSIGAVGDTPLSLAMLFSLPSSFIINALLTSLNIFTLWRVIILTSGVSVLCNFGVTRSVFLVLLVWLLSLVFNLGSLKLLEDALHLLL
jgi:hypothetical protein